MRSLVLLLHAAAILTYFITYHNIHTHYTRKNEKSSGNFLWPESPEFRFVLHQRTCVCPSAPVFVCNCVHLHSYTCFPICRMHFFSYSYMRRQHEDALQHDAYADNALIIDTDTYTPMMRARRTANPSRHCRQRTT